MNDAQVRLATCQVTCGKDSGTGWLATPSRVVTARHNVDDAISAGSKISLRFEGSGVSYDTEASILADDETLDVCVLALPSELDFATIPLNEATPIEGSRFSAFGYPVVKLSIGHRLEGSISQVLDIQQLGIDLDLLIDASASLTSYRGISGAPLLVDGHCQGMLRLRVDNSIGAISVVRMATFLRNHAILAEEPPDDASSEEPLASRENFTKAFESLIKDNTGTYLFIEGAHGIGKSTFCRTYRPLEPTLEHFGTYSFTSQGQAVNAMHLAQPEVFFDWLTTVVSSRFGGRSRRAAERQNYARIIVEIQRVLTDLGKTYLSKGKFGVVLLDGLDEVAKLGAETLERFVGLLPASCPAGLAIAVSAPSYSNLSAALGARVKSRACIAMPPLVRSIARRFCAQELLPERGDAETIRIICDKAQGHPLYLRYLIDLANDGADDSQLAGLPLINGRIQVYYERLWSGLLSDPEAVNLLAIVARLRWGIATHQLVDMLTNSEQAVLVNTISRVQHLLLKRDETAIYHSSFADFLNEKTALRERDVQHRLFAYCSTHSDTHYGTLNCVYHGLRSGAEQASNAVSRCDQHWVDRCVLLGAVPDALLGDLDDVLAVATREGSFVEVVRILLLAQRLQFRYDTLFAQSADLAAHALLSLGKVPEALQHAVRYGHLIIPVPNALRLAHELNQRSEFEAALDLLDRIESVLESYLSDKNLRIGQFIVIVELRAQLQLLRHRAGDEDAHRVLLALWRWAAKALGTSASNDQHRSEMLHDLNGRLSACWLYLAARYTKASTLREHTGTIQGLDQVLPRVVAGVRAYHSQFGIPPDQGLLELLYSDLSTLLQEAGDHWDKPDLGTLDAFVALGAPTDLVKVLSDNKIDNDAPFQFIAKDNVTTDASLFATGMARRRLASFLDQDLPCPTTSSIESNAWKDGIEGICEALAWCDGAARRGKRNGDEDDLSVVWGLLEKHVFEHLRLTLAKRAAWEDSYAIPESAFPALYEHLTRLVIDVFPARAGYVISFIDGQFAEQCGLYNEGFRDVLARVLSLVSEASPDETIGNQARALLNRWREFVQANLKNRHELVPELLTIIPLLVRYDALEQAQEAYRAVLATSMGPSWYKEDQLSLMVGAVNRVPWDESLEAGILSRIAGSLEAASGEMTFQRFVRYEKTALIANLCQRKDYLGAAQYFIRQTCGTPEQLMSEATEGAIDRISPLRGTRFPGGALDEQDALLRMLEVATPHAEWPLCWALLEIYQFGDRRHIARSAEAYARIAAQTQSQNDDQRQMIDRLKIVLESEIADDERSTFLSELRKSLPEGLLNSFEDIVGQAPPFNEVVQETVSSAAESAGATTNNDSGDDEEQERPDWPEDMVLMPGMLGSQSSNRASIEALSRAEKELSRGNRSAARTNALAALQHLQRGGWSIWGSHSAEATRAEDILRLEAESASQLVKQYGPLILSERYVDKWRRANHLIARAASIATREERAAVLRHAVEHVEIMIGNAVAQTAEHRFLETPRGESASLAILEILIAAIEHPQWIRREKAAELVLWLLKEHPQYIQTLGPRAFTMDSGIHPDVLCGALDHLSLSNPIQLWDRLSAALDLDATQRICKHAGRLGVLLRIADRAEQDGSTGAAEALRNLRAAIFLTTESEGSAQAVPHRCPTWALAVESEWKRLATMGLATQGLVDRATAVIRSTCVPLSIEASMELEGLLAEGFNEKRTNPLRRWAARARYALQVALLPVASIDNLYRIEQAFRSYNPSLINHLRILGFSSPAMRWIKELEEGSGTFEPAHGTDVYLSYLERIWDADNHQYRIFEITAFFYNSGTRPVLPKKPARFLSTECPAGDSVAMPESCTTVIPRTAYFGSFTPAVPSPAAMQMLGADGADLTRAHWRRGRVSIGRGGHFLREGCFLAIKQASVRLPHGIDLAWVCEIDGKIAGIVGRAA